MAAMFYNSSACMIVSVSASYDIVIVPSSAMSIFTSKNESTSPSSVKSNFTYLSPLIILSILDSSGD